ncbi:UbiA family prenyltransferase [Actibacterium sp. MT2.3-13A]|uniref:UbiA family prenyltransferase n=1 Tax=Actibacterium sp. MT2.3-13A TaxID=2828332 RepID=UPI001BA73A92
MDASDHSSDIPLVCDLDGTVTPADTTYELILLYLKAHPVTGWLTILRWLRRGRGHLKARLAEAVGARLDTAQLPLDEGFLDSGLFREARRKALVSGAPQAVVESVSIRLSGFECAAGSTAERNLTAEYKAAYLRQTFPEGFDYVGDSRDDLPVWQAARRAYAVNADPRTVQAAQARGIEIETLSPRRPFLGPLLQEMRLHQWAKNGLIFLVPLLSLSGFSWEWALNLVLAFVSLGLVVSSTYLLNDLLDLQDDRLHPIKRKRPFAAGALTVKQGLLSIIGLSLTGLGMSLVVGPVLTVVLLFYAAVSMGYSFMFKRVVVLDAFVLAFLFCLRVLIGVLVTGATTNAWFFTAVATFFLSLALGKRCIELEHKWSGEVERHLEALSGRGYCGRDFPVVLGLGMTVGMISPLITMIYALLSEDSIVESTVVAFVISTTLMFWMGRFWILVNRGAIDDDPVYFALKDGISRASLLVILAAVLVEQMV